MRGALAAIKMDADGLPKERLVLVRGLLPPVYRADLLASRMLANAGAQSLALAKRSTSANAGPCAYLGHSKRIASMNRFSFGGWSRACG